MNTSKKILAGIVTAGILGTTAIAWAQPGMGGGCNMGDGPRMMKSGMKFDPAARADQHLTQFKSQLKITAQQEPLWNAFAEKARAEAGKGMQAMREKARDDKLTAPERMTQRNAAMKERLAAHEGVTDAFTRLYDSLTPEQKKVADQGMGRMGAQGRGGPRMQGPGPQGMGDMERMREYRHG